MFKAITATLFAALIIGATAIAPGVSRTIEPPAPQRSLKGDRLQVAPAGAACGQSAWPYYEADCLRGRTQAAAQPRKMRIVAVDRRPARHLTAVH
jgi:hypothetical protein